VGGGGGGGRGLFQTYKNTKRRNAKHTNHVGRSSVIGCLILIGHFLQKSPVNCGPFVANDLQMVARQASLEPPRATGVGPESLKMVYPRNIFQCFLGSDVSDVRFQI